MTANELLSRLKKVRRNGKSWLALCPAHDDHSPSLSISDSDNGRVMFHCFAGCSPDQVRASLGIDPNSPIAQESHPRPDSSGQPPSDSRVLAVYDYSDEKGVLLFQVVRLDTKKFRQRQPDGKGGWSWNLKGVRRVLYRLPELLAADPSSMVFICEGEKDADRLTALGLLATTNPGGAGKWRAEYNDSLRGRQVCLLPDNDEPGRKHAQEVAKSLHDVAEIVKVVALPGLAEKGDMSEWLAMGNGIEALRELVDATATFEPADNAHTPATPDDQALESLAELSPLQYERQRLIAAKTLKCRPATLDKLVNALRPKPQGGLQGRGVELEAVELWPKAVIGAEVLSEVADAFSRYLVLPPGAADVLAMWCAHAHVFEAFDYSPRLNFSSPEKGCGKTTARDVVGLFVPRPLATENLSVAVLFRIIESQKPILLADECDAWVNDNEELRGLLNAGHRRGGQALRCEGEANEVRAFHVFGPAVLCGIGSLPGTLHDRSIVIRLERAKPGELRQRFDSRRIEHEQELTRKLARFAADNRAELESRDPELPPGAFNRLADNWRPLYAVAEVAGGDWLQRITDAFTKLVLQSDTDAQGLGVMLLADIQQVFAEKNAERLFSKELVDALCAMADRPWVEARRDKPITESWLARKLRPFGVLPNTLRVDAGRAKGYELNKFSNAFLRYLPDPGVSNRDSVTSRVNIDENAISKRDTEDLCHGSKTQETRINIGLSRCHDSDARETAELLVVGEI